MIFDQIHPQSGVIQEGPVESRALLPQSETDLHGGRRRLSL